MADLFQALGAIAGFASFLFVVWERWFRLYPTALLISVPLIEGGANKALSLRLTNNATRPLIATFEGGLSSRSLSVSSNNTLTAIAQSLSLKGFSIALDAGETQILPVFFPENYMELSGEAVLELPFTWQFAQPIFWQRERSTIVRTSKRAIQIMTDDWTELLE